MSDGKMNDLVWMIGPGSISAAGEDRSVMLYPNANTMSLPIQVRENRLLHGDER